MNPVRNRDQYMLKENVSKNGRTSVNSNGVKFLLGTLVLILGFATHTYAQGFIPLAPITELTDPATIDSVARSNNLAVFFNSLYKYAIGLAAVLAVIEIIWGGLQISTQDSISKQGEGRERIQQAIIGLILVLSPVLVFSIINPSILNLSISLGPLDLTVKPMPVTPSTQVQADQSGCTADTQCTAGYTCIGYVQGKTPGTCRSTQIEQQPGTMQCRSISQKALCDAESLCTWVQTRTTVLCASKNTTQTF